MAEDEELVRRVDSKDDSVVVQLATAAEHVVDKGESISEAGNRLSQFVGIIVLGTILWPKPKSVTSWPLQPPISPDLFKVGEVGA